MKLVVKDLHPAADGEYEFPREDSLTNRDLRFIKQQSGVRAGEIRDALLAGDNDLIVCFALIAIQRSGKEIDADVVWDAPIGGIDVLADEEDEDNSPPESRPDSERSESGPSESSSPSSNVGGA